MKINFFSPFSPITSGVVDYSEDLAAAMEKRGATVHRVNQRFWSSARLHLPGMYSSYRSMRYDRMLTLLVSPLYPIPPSSPDTINHFHVSGGYFNYPVVKHFYAVGGRRVLTVHDQNFVTPNWRYPYDEAEQLRMLRESDLIIVHTQELKKRLEFINPKIEVIRHGVTNERFALDPLEAKRRIGIPELMVSQIGFLFNHKGVQNFIKAVAQIDVTALIAGSGPDEAAVRRLADLLCPGKIVFRPYLSKEEYPLYIAASDIVVFPRIHSQGECSGVLVQAMAAGKAIVAHDIGCYKEYLSNHRGILTKLEDISALQAAILDLIHHEKKRRQLGRACQEFARQRLEWDTIAEQHLQLFEGLIKKRK